MARCGPGPAPIRFMGRDGREGWNSRGGGPWLRGVGPPCGVAMGRRPLQSCALAPYAVLQDVPVEGLPGPFTCTRIQMHDDPPDLLSEALEILEDLLARLARKKRLDPDEADDVSSEIRLKFVENDYAVLRSLKEPRALRSVLALFVMSRWRDHVVAELGRWRPSAAAERSGELAVELERLIHREGLSPHEAFEQVRTRGLTDASDLDLARLMAELPDRAPMRPEQVPLDAVAEIPGSATPEDLLEAKEVHLEWEEVRTMLRNAQHALSAEEQVVIRMLFWDKMTIADVARALGLDQKPLYRQRDGLKARIERTLVDGGLSAEVVHRLVGNLPPDPGSSSDPSV